MSYSEYWDGDNELPKYYRKKYQTELQRKNFELWLQGYYIYEALLSAAPVLNALMKDKHPIPYRDHVLPLTKAEYEREVEREKEKQMRKNIEAMEALTIEFNKKFKQKGGDKVD